MLNILIELSIRTRTLLPNVISKQPLKLSQVLLLRRNIDRTINIVGKLRIYLSRVSSSFFQLIQYAVMLITIRSSVYDKLVIYVLVQQLSYYIQPRSLRLSQYSYYVVEYYSRSIILYLLYQLSCVSRQASAYRYYFYASLFSCACLASLPRARCK